MLFLGGPVDVVSGIQVLVSWKIRLKETSFKVLGEWLSDRMGNMGRGMLMCYMLAHQWAGWERRGQVVLLLFYLRFLDWSQQIKLLTSASKTLNLSSHGQINCTVYTSFHARYWWGLWRLFYMCAANGRKSIHAGQFCCQSVLMSLWVNGLERQQLSFLMHFVLAVVMGNHNIFMLWFG